MHFQFSKPLCALVVCLMVGCSASNGPAAAPIDFDLPNGLHVILQPVRGAQQTAVVTLFSIGGDHDPQGASGLAHYVEHLYVTAAAGDDPARTTEQFVRAYPHGWNAQTGDDYTVFATVVEPTDLNTEIRRHAKRIGDLRIDDTDLRRELPRIESELANMFGRMPALGAMNLARERVRPTPLEGRKGGRVDHLKDVAVEQLQSRWQKFYKPVNAVFVIAGDFDAGQVRQAIEAGFGDLPRGDSIPSAEPSPEPPGPLAAESVEVDPIQPTLVATVTLAFTAPLPGSRDYPPFLCLVNRLLMQNRFAGNQPQATEPSLRYSFLDDPHVLFVTAELKPNETAGAAEARLREFVDQAVAAPWNANERMLAKQNLAFFLDTMPLPDQAVAQNIYGTAFGTGRRHQLGINGKSLARNLDRTTAAAVKRVGQQYLSTERGAVVAATIKNE